MKTDLSIVIISGKSRATLDETGGCAKVWFLHRNSEPTQIRIQQSLTGIMFWASIVEIKFIHHF